MIISISICTYNRVEFLKLCLDAILDQTQQEKGIEINVIDNNSEDATKSMVQTLQKHHTNINYYFEANQGLSYARNKAVKVANGSHVAFVDDDATIEKYWLRSLLDAIKTQPDLVVFGGPIFPTFEMECPEWIDKTYFVRQFKSVDGYLKGIKAEQGFSGGNMCIPKALFQNHTNFDVNLGMTGTQLGVGEEQDFFIRLKERHPEVRFYNIQKMGIIHFESTQKLQKAYLKNRITMNAKELMRRSCTKASPITISVMILKFKMELVSIPFYFIISFWRPRFTFKALKSLWTVQAFWTYTFNKK